MVPQFSLKRNPVSASTNTASKPDVACLGNILAYSWTDVTNNLLLVDKYGGEIVKFSPGAGECKVVSDGSLVWFFSQVGTALSVYTYSSIGAQTATLSIGTVTASIQRGTVVFDTVRGVTLAWNKNGSGTTISYLAPGISQAAGDYRDHRLNKCPRAADAKQWTASPTAWQLSTQGGTLKAYQINATPAISHTYASSTLVTTDSSLLAGYVMNANADVNLCSFRSLPQVLL